MAAQCVNNNALNWPKKKNQSVALIMENFSFLHKTEQMDKASITNLALTFL